MNVYDALSNIEETLSGDYREEFKVIVNFIEMVADICYRDDIDGYDKSEMILKLIENGRKIWI